MTELVPGELDLDRATLLELLERERTYRRAVEMERDENALKLAALEGAQVSFWDWHLQTGLGILGERWIESLGYLPEELPDSIETWHALLLPGERERADTAMIAHLEKGEPYDIVLRHRAKAGEVVHTRYRGQAVRDHEGGWTRMVGARVDLTQVRVLEQELSRAMGQYQLVYHMSPDMYCSVDPEANIKECNQTLAARLATPRENFIGRSLAEICHPCCHLELAEVLENFLESGQVRNAELELRGPDGGPIPVLLSVNAVRGKNQRILRGVCCWRDVSDVRRVEAELRALSWNLEKRVEARTRELEDSNRELERFAFVASHDLQEPMRTVSNFTGLLRKELGQELPSRIDDYLKFIEDGALRMRRLTKDLLTFARLGRSGKSIESVDLGQLAETVKKDLESALADSEGHIEVGPLPTIRGDVSQLRQMFQNLVANGVKFRGEAAPRIQIRAREVPGEIIVDFIDNGIGIQEEDQQQVFEAFRRLHTWEEYEGTGIGLAIVARVASNHGGRVSVDSEPGRGSTFTVRLPAGVGESGSPG